jgi:hypothetical protein
LHHTSKTLNLIDANLKGCEVHLFSFQENVTLLEEDKISISYIDIKGYSWVPILKLFDANSKLAKLKGCQMNSVIKTPNKTDAKLKGSTVLLSVKK